MHLDINIGRNIEKTDVTNTSNESDGDRELVIKTLSQILNEMHAALNCSMCFRDNLSHLNVVSAKEFCAK